MLAALWAATPNCDAKAKHFWHRKHKGGSMGRYACLLCQKCFALARRLKASRGGTRTDSEEAAVSEFLNQLWCQTCSSCTGLEKAFKRVVASGKGHLINNASLWNIFIQ